MKSKIIEEDRKALAERAKAMTPEERLVAFLNHSRLVYKLVEAGRKYRSKSSRTQSRKNKTSSK